MRQVAWDHLPEIMKLCRGTLVVNYLDEMFSELGVTPVHRIATDLAVKLRTGVDVRFLEVMRRSHRVHWAVLERAQP
jgi:hypothetical protein